MYTEEEAKHKECKEMTGIISLTMVIARTVGNASDDAIDNCAKIMHCSASECMHWRWGYEQSTTDSIIKTTGYCGKSGRP